MSGHWLMLEGAGPPASFRSRLAAAGRCLPLTHLDLERLTGIRERRVAVGQEDSHSLAVAAARDCLKRAEQYPGVVVGVDCSPGSDVALHASRDGGVFDAAVSTQPGPP